MLKGIFPWLFHYHLTWRAFCLGTHTFLYQDIESFIASWFYWGPLFLQQSVVIDFVAIFVGHIELGFFKRFFVGLQWIGGLALANYVRYTFVFLFGGLFFAGRLLFAEREVRCFILLIFLIVHGHLINFNRFTFIACPSVACLQGNHVVGLLLEKLVALVLVQEISNNFRSRSPSIHWSQFVGQWDHRVSAVACLQGW